MELPNKVRFGQVAGAGVLHLTQSETAEPHYRMEDNGRFDSQCNLVLLAKHLSAHGIDHVITARSRIYIGEPEYQYPVSNLTNHVYTESLTEIMSVAVSPEDTETLLNHKHCRPLCFE